MEIPGTIRSFLTVHRTKIISIQVISVLTSIVTLLLPLSIGKFMDLMFSAGKIKNIALHTIGIRLPNRFDYFFLFFGVLLISKFLLSWWVNFQSAQVGSNFLNDIRSRLFAHQVNRKINGNKMKASELLAYTNEAKFIQNYLLKGLMGFAKDVLFLTIAFFFLLKINFILTSVVVISLVLFFLFQKIYNQQRKEIFQQKRSNYGSFLNFISHSILLSKNRNEDAFSKFEKKSNRYLSSLRKFQLSTSFLKSLTPLMVYSLLGVVMLTMYLIKLQEIHSTGDTIAYLLLLMSIFPSIKNILRVNHIWIQGKLSLQKYESLFNSTDNNNSLPEIESEKEEDKENIMYSSLANNKTYQLTSL